MFYRWIRSVTCHRAMALSVFPVLLALFLAACQQDEPSAVKIDAKPVIREEMERFNRTAEQLYKNAAEGKYEEVKNELMAMEKQVTEMRFEGVTSVEGMNALIDAILTAEKLYNAMQLDEQKGYLAVAKIRMAADALTHERQPMWIQYYQILREDLERVKRSLNERQRQNGLQALQSFSAHYDIIRPSAIIQRPPQQVEKIDSLLAFLERQFTHRELQPEYIASGLQHLEVSLDELFGKTSATAYLPLSRPFHPGQWAAGLGFIIAAVLAYAGWRMYRYEKTVTAANRKKENRDH